MASPRELSIQEKQVKMNLSEKEKSEVFALNWQTQGIHKLPSKCSSWLASSEHPVVIGNEAKKFAALLKVSIAPSLDAISIDSKGNPIFIFNYDGGYITLDNWKTIDFGKNLAKIKNEAARSNAMSHKTGKMGMQILDWIQEPILDESKHILSWSVEGMLPGKVRVFSATAIKLGRHGFEIFMWQGFSNDYEATKKDFDKVVSLHLFDQDNTYYDRKSEDTIAGSIDLIPMELFINF
jgi:uncharacterized membrane-anchored protein